jgi:hypothetical protein
MVLLLLKEAVRLEWKMRGLVKDTFTHAALAESNVLDGREGFGKNGDEEGDCWDLAGSSVRDAEDIVL